MTYDNEFNSIGLYDPLPVLRAKKILATMTVGQTLKIRATDAGSIKDFDAFSKQTGHELLVSCKDFEVDGEFYFVLKKSVWN